MRQHQNRNQNQGHNQNKSRGRGRKPGSGNNNSNNNANRTFDSNGPDVKIRGSATHIHEKYQTLARDANAAGDRIGAENYLQHAEHYFRLMAAAQAAQAERQAQQAQQNQQRQRQNSKNEGAPASGEDASRPTETKGGTTAESGNQDPEVQPTETRSPEKQSSESQPGEEAKAEKAPARTRAPRRRPRAKTDTEEGVSEAAPAGGAPMTVAEIAAASGDVEKPARKRRPRPPKVEVAAPE